MTEDLDRRRPSVPRRIGSKVVELLGELLAEALFAAAACLLAGLALVGAVWGWNRHPEATTVAGAAMALLLGYWAWNLRPKAQNAQDRGQRSRIAGVAVGAFLVVAVWLLYVVIYCACT